MTFNDDDPSLAIYEQTQKTLNTLGRLIHLRATEVELDLIRQLRHQVHDTYWQARLDQRIAHGSVAATPFCRRIFLGVNQQEHLEEVNRGMLAAEQSMSQSGGSPPWNRLIFGRSQFTRGQARNSFECGFILRLFQMIHELSALNRQRAGSPPGDG